MDESYQNRIRKTHTRIASIGDKNLVNLSSTYSPQLFSNFASFMSNGEQRRTGDNQFGLNSSLSSQNKSFKMKKVQPSSQNNNSYQLEKLSASIDKPKVGALTLRAETPSSDRNTYSSVDKPMSRAQSRSRKDSKEMIEKIVNSPQLSYGHKRASSNPRVSPNSTGYSIIKVLAKGSIEKGKKLYLGKDFVDEEPKVTYMKEGWIPMNASTTAAIKSGVSRKPLRMVNSREQDSFRDKKTSNKHNNQPSESNFLSNFSQLEKSYIKLKNTSSCVDVDEPKLPSNLGKDLQKIGFKIKQDPLLKKQSSNDQEKPAQRSQERQPVKEANPAKDIADSSKFSRASKVTKLEDKDSILNYRPLDTEEVYEDFFNTSKMQFDFERTRVSMRSENLKDHYKSEPKRRPSISRAANRNPEKDRSLNESANKMFDDQNLRAKNF